MFLGTTYFLKMKNILNNSKEMKQSPLQKPGAGGLCIEGLIRANLGSSVLFSLEPLSGKSPLLHTSHTRDAPRLLPVAASPPEDRLLF